MRGYLITKDEKSSQSHETGIKDFQDTEIAATVEQQYGGDVNPQRKSRGDLRAAPALEHEHACS
jgi:hypothetical protein